MKQLGNDIKVKDALHEIFKENVALLKDSKSLMAKIEQLAPNDYVNLALFRSALLKANIGEFIAARDIENPDARDKVKHEAIELLKKQNLSEENSENIIRQILDAIPRNTVEPPPPPPPPPPVDYYSLGIKMLEDNNYQDAVTAFTKDIELFPTHVEAYNMRAMVYAKTAEYDKAIIDYTEVIAQKSDNISAYRNRGMCYYANSNNSKAVADFDVVLKANPNDKDIIELKRKILGVEPPLVKTAADYYEDGVNAFNNNKYNDAITAFNKAIEIFPTYVEAYNMRAMAYEKIADYDKAIKDYNEVILKNPQDISTYRNRGMCYYKLEKFSEALIDFDRVLQSNPDDKEIVDLKKKILSTYYPPTPVEQGLMQKFFSTKGRLNRKRYFLRGLALALPNFLGFFLIFLADAKTTPDNNIFVLLGLLGFAIVLVGMISSVTLLIRRLHDLDKSGWWAIPLWILSIISWTPRFQILSIVSMPFFLYILFKRGTVGSNQYGLDPLGITTQANYETIVSDEETSFISRVFNANCLKISGRINRMRFCKYSILILFIEITIYFIITNLGFPAFDDNASLSDPARNLLFALFFFGFLLLGYPSSCRRIHDIGRNENLIKFMFGLSIVTLVFFMSNYSLFGISINTFLLFYLLLIKGEDKANQYGEAVSLPSAESIKVIFLCAVTFVTVVFLFALSNVLYEKELAEKYTNRGIALADELKYDTALDMYNKALKLNTKYATAYYNRGEAYFEKEDYDKALEDFNSAITLKPEYAEAYCSRGNVYFEKIEYDKANDEFNQALKLNSDYYRAHIGLGNVYNMECDYDKAIEEYDKAIKLKSDSYEAFSNRGIAYLQKKQYNEALNDLNKAISLKSNYYKGYNSLATYYYNGKEYDDAEKEINKAIKLNPNYSVSYSNLGYLYTDKNQYDKAINFYNKALSLRATYPAAYVGRAMASFFRNNNDSKTALEDITKALTIAPKYANAYKTQGIIYYQIGKNNEALKSFNEVKKIKPKDFEGYWGCGLIYAAMEQYDNAIQEYNSAIDLSINEADIYNYRGVAYYYIKDYDRAIADFDKAIELNYSPIDTAKNNRDVAYQAKNGNY